MELTSSLKQAICSLFEVHADEDGVQRVITPMEYSGSSDRIVIRIRPSPDGFSVDENGEASLYASMAGGDSSSESVLRWAEEMEEYSPVRIGDDDMLTASTNDQRLIPSYIFRVAEYAQQMYALSMSRTPRQASQLKELVSKAVDEASKSSGATYESNVTLPIAGDFVADHVINTESPLIIIAATGIQRLLEAEIIHMQYRIEKAKGIIIAAVESQKSVGIKQFERANYYTGKTVAFNPSDFGMLLQSYMQ